MEANLDDLSHQLAALTERFADLGAKLAEAAGELQAAGAPPSDALVEALGIARQHFIDLRTDVLAAAETADIVAPQGIESLASLEPLLAAVADVVAVRARRAALEQAREGVLTVLDRVLEIVHRDDPDFTTLVGCHARARELRSAVLDLADPEPGHLQALTESIRAFSDLLTMVEERDALNDEQYAHLEETVSTAFGRSLAVAVARGRLVIGPVPEELPAPDGGTAFPASPLQMETEVPGTPEPEPTPEPELTLEPQASLQPEATVEPHATLEPQATEPLATLAPEAALELEREAPAGVDAPLELGPSASLPMTDAEPAPLEMESAVDTGAAPLAVEPSAELQTVEREPESQPEPAPSTEAQESAAPDETAQWWLAAWARWSGWKSSLGFADAVREELAKYPYLLSVPIQRSAEYEDGLLAYGYSIVMEHVEKQYPGCVGNALNSLEPAEGRPVGDQLYAYLVIQGRLAQTYPEFVRSVMLSALPEPGFWFSNRLLDSREDTRVFQRPSGRLGETEQTGRRLAADAQRFVDHRFALTLAPLTTRFVVAIADHREARGMVVNVSMDGAPSDSAWLVTVPSRGKATAKIGTRRVDEDGTALPGLGRDYSALWIGAFNADPAAEHQCDVTISLRKDVRSPFAAKRP
jgi:hypothetical protein